MTDKDLIEKAKKILALAEKGVEGERDNAKALLYVFLEKYGLKLEDLDDTLRTPHKFYGTRRKDELVIAVAASVLRTSTIHYRYCKKGEHYLEIQCSDYEAVEIRQKVEFYWKVLQKEYRAFFIAFCVTNKLCNPDHENDPDKIYTPEEWELFRKINAYAQGINPSTFNRRLQDNNGN